jgi:hypothetical protein
MGLLDRELDNEIEYPREKPMTLSDFIRQNHPDIIDEFVVFARTLMRSNSPMSEQDFRDHCEDLLDAIAEDQRSVRNVTE